MLFRKISVPRCFKRIDVTNMKHDHAEHELQKSALLYFGYTQTNSCQPPSLTKI